MQRVAKQVLRMAPQLQAGASLQSKRAMSMDGIKGMKESEKAIEDLYFTKEDQRLLSKLMGKIKAQSDVADKHAAEGVLAAELSALKQIVEKYKIDKADIDKLLKWKHTHY